MKYKNHEGYSDLTAGKAIRHTSKKRAHVGLVYRLEELESFRNVRKIIKYEQTG